MKFKKKILVIVIAIFAIIGILFAVLIGNILLHESQNAARNW